MTREMMQAALDKVPELVAKMSAYYHEEGMYVEVCEWYTSRGTMYNRDAFVITEATLIDHIERAHRKGFEISVTDEVVEVVRNLSDGERIVVRYYPTEGSGELVDNGDGTRHNTQREAAS